MAKLIARFAPHCADRDTLDELAAMVDERGRWRDAHDLFGRIRNKTLQAEQRDARREAQYLFEEICAKTLYNLSGSSAPFDPDSPYWIVPNAFDLARALGIDSAAVLDIVAV